MRILKHWDKSLIVAGLVWALPSQAAINECESLNIVFGGSHYTDFAGTEDYFYFLNPRELQGQRENGVSDAVFTEAMPLENVEWKKMLRVEQDHYYLLRSNTNSSCAVKVSTAGEILDAHECGNPVKSFSPEKGCL